MGFGIGIGIGWPNASAGISYAKKLIKAFKERVLSYPTSIFEAEACLDATLTELNAIGLLKEASLVITPNAYNEGILYDVVPNTTLGDMNVVRATTATRVNSAGLIEVVPRNLFTYSEEFNNADWSKFQATITANNTTAPNGTLTADKLESSVNGTAVLFRTASTGAGVSTISVYAKAGTNDILDIGFTNVSDFTVKANLTTGTITSATSGITGTITSVGNGWYRVTATRTMTASGTGFINSATSISGRFIYIWGGQLDLGNATEYFPTTTRLNIPRIDYTNGSCPSLLVEPQRTNVLTYSNDFSNAAWTKNTGAILANNATSPEGITNASKLVGVALTTQQWIYRLNTAVVSGSQYTFSMFAKKGEYNFIQLRNISNIDANTVFNLNTGTVYINSAGTAKIENYGNGWYRCSVTATATATGNSNIYVNLSTNGTGQQSFLGNGTSGVFIYGAQRELGSYPTSYIPTIASTVTRNADVISKTGISSLIGQTEGTLFCEINLPNPLSTGGKAIVIIGTSPNRIYIAKEGTTTNIFQLATQSASGFNFINSAVITTSKVKFAIAYKGGDNAFYINGSLISSASATANPTSFPNLLIGDTSPQTNTDIKINSVQLYKTRLSNTELQSLTTL